jgi:hypothetical protein
MSTPLMHCLAALLILLLSALGVNAAEIRTHNHSVIILDGKIERGDYDKVLSTAKKLGPDLETLFLASSGGNLIEAMRIGRLTRQLRWSTQVRSKNSFIEDLLPGNYKEYGFEKSKLEHQLVCASSCFFIYAGGVRRFGGEIGIHRPYLSDEDYARMSGNEAIDKSKSIARIVDDYLREMGIPSRFSEAMFSIQKDSIRWLNQKELDELNGYIPGLEDWVNSKCGSSADFEREMNKIWQRTGKDTPEAEKLEEKLYNRLRDCTNKLMREMRQEAWDNFFGKN